MKMRITNYNKFLKSFIILIFLLILFSIVCNYTLSYGESKYKILYVNKGDTIWKIAQNEIKVNEYYKNKDIREVVYSIKEINKLNTSDIKIGQKLLIPEN